jgi:hypothetical protein
MLERPLMGGHALRGRRRRTLGRLDDFTDGIGRALRERRRRGILRRSEPWPWLFSQTARFPMGFP